MINVDSGTPHTFFSSRKVAVLAWDDVETPA